MSIKFSCVTLRHMSFGGGVVLTVTFQKVDAAPHAQAAAQRDNQSLQNLNRLCKEIHRSILLSFVGIIRLKVGRFQFVHLERLVRLHDGWSAFHVPFHIKEILLVGVGGVFVIRMFRQVVLVREERAHAPQHEDTLASVHYCQFVLCHQLLSQFLIGEAVRNLAATVLRLIKTVDRFFPQQLRDLLQGGFLFASQKQGAVAVTHDGIRRVLVDGL